MADIFLHQSLSGCFLSLTLACFKQQHSNTSTPMSSLFEYGFEFDSAGDILPMDAARCTVFPHSIEIEDMVLQANCFV